MASRAQQLATAVAASITAAELSQAVTVERTYVPLHQVEQLDGIVVPVVAGGIESQRVARDSFARDYTIEIGLQKHVGHDLTGPDQLAEVYEELLDLIEQTASHSVTGGRMLLMGVETVTPLVNPQHLKEHRVSTSVFRATYRWQA